MSITDRCNFRCTYCMPRDQFGPDHQFLPRAELLGFEEITRVVSVLAGLGVRKVRLTGGEPLVRRDVADLVRMLAAVEGIDDIAMTTNASLLAPLAAPLRAAGLSRLTISLDALDDAVFREMSDTKIPVGHVLEGIAAAQEAGFATIKLNCVVRRGVNEDQIVPLAAYGRDHGLVVRFIEYMDVGTTNGWQMGEVVPSRDVVARVAAAFPVDPVEPGYPGEVAQRWRYVDGGGELGVISSVSQPFCRTCTRARLSAIGELYTCLFAGSGTDVRAWLRDGVTDAALQARLAQVWRGRSDRYSELRTEQTAAAGRKVEMSYIGG
ncbi:MAG TPA: GTP 3',8-cyclase MoaA [Euzebyales bacterium]|nr:GTP 3',8-cyclase MoaA [Euzebyales bacterium]